MNQVDKEVCLAILERGLKVVPDGPIVFTNPEIHKKEVFLGLAKDWERFEEKDFQDFMKQHIITAQTPIAVADLDNNKFAVIKIGYYYPYK